MTTSISIIVDSTTIHYGDQIPVFQYTITCSDSSFDTNTIRNTIQNPFNCSATITSPVGDYNILLNESLFSDYHVNFTQGILTINRKDLTITAENKSKNYNGSTFNNNDYTVTYSSFVNGESSNNLGGSLVFNTGQSYNAINTGVYNITPSGLTSNNYNIIFENGTLTINKKDLTIKAENKSKTYDGIVFNEYTVTYTSFVNNETESVLSGVLEFNKINPYNAINTGVYNITPSGLTSNNYNIIFENGTLTINKVNLIITRLTTDYSYTYGDTNILYTQFYSYSGFVNNETIAVISGTPTIYLNGTSIPLRLVSGTYDVTINDIETLTATNYLFSNGNIINSGTVPKLIINKKLLSITSDNKSKSYDGNVFNAINYSVQYSGFVYGETSTVL